MKISIVTSVFNRVGTIGETIESVRRQRYSEIEHIIQDGASTDGTLSVLARYSSSQLIVNSGPDNGIYDGINRGIAKASGDVIGLLHSDDVFAHENVLTLVAETFAEHPEIHGVYGDLVYVSRHNPERVVRYWKSGPFCPDLIKKGWMPPHPTLYLRRKVFEQFGLYDPSYRVAADYEAMLRYLSSGSISLGYLPQVMVKMRTGGESNRSLRSLLRKSREDYRAIRYHGIGGLGTLFAKNLSKLGQFLPRDEK